MNYAELNEKKEHGTFAFPIEYARLDAMHRAYVMVPHWHDEMEILRVESGCFHLQLNNCPYTMRAGDVALVNPGVLHRGTPENCVYECAVFQLNMLCPTGSVIHHYVRPITRRRMLAKAFFAHGESPAVETAVEHLFSAFHEKKQKYEFAVFSALHQLLFALYSEEQIDEATANPSRDRRLTQITSLLEWISKNHTQKITLERLSKESGLNEKYLCRFFKEYTSYTPIEYVNRFRLEKAIDDMVTRHVSITEAAFANGFNDSAYFSKVFQRFKGVQPTQYLKNMKENAYTSDS